jgi:hypothetical protein
MKFLRRYRDECTIGFLAVILSSAIFLFVWNTVGLSGLTWGGNDFLEYNILAQNVLDGNGFSLRNAEPYESSAVRTPGYPLFLAVSHAVSGNTVVASVLQIVLFAGFGILSYHVLLLLGLKRLYAFGGAILAVVELDVLSMSLYLISDMLFVFLLMLSLYFYLRFLRENDENVFVWGSLAVGLAALVRPVGVILFVIFAVTFLIRRGLRRELFYSAIIVLALLLPWSVRNFATFGTWRISSADTFNRYAVISSQIVGYRDGISYPEARESLMEKFIQDPEVRPFPPTDNVGYVNYGYAREEFLLFDNFHYDEWMKKEIKEIFWSSPVSYVKVILFGTIEYLTQVNWLTPLEHWNVLHPSYRPTKSVQQIFFEDGFTPLMQELGRRFSCGTSCIIAFGLNGVGRIFWAVVIIFSGVGFFRALFSQKKDRLVLMSVLSLILIYSLIHIFFIGTQVQPRYRMPFVPFFIGFALYGAAVFWVFIKRSFSHVPVQK